MPLNFRNLSRAAAVVCLALALTWLLAPEFLLAIWQIEHTSSAGLVSRRAAALFLGVGVMFVLARNAPPSPARAALASGFVVACLALAALGVFEFLGGHAGPGILSAVIVELALALGFLAAGRAEPDALESGVRDAAIAVESQAPVPSEIASYLPSAHFHDAWSIVAADPSLSALGQFLRAAADTPAWVDALMSLRNKAVAVVRLKNLGGLSQFDSSKSEAQYRPGDRIGIFTLIKNSPDEALIGDRDKHLNVTLSIHKAPPAPTGEVLITVTTVVHIHNLLGRIYMLPVAPIHRAIVPSVLKSVGLPPRPTEALT